MGSAQESDKSAGLSPQAPPAPGGAMAPSLPRKQAQSQTAPQAAQPLNPFHPFNRTAALHILFTTAWISILLGLSVQGAMLIAKVGAGTTPKIAQVLADVAGGISWAAIVCFGLSLGTVAARYRQEVMSLLGLICAPLAWAGAKGAQRAAAWMLGQPMEVIGPLTYQVGALKAIEYAVLGFFLARLIKSARSTPQRHAILGFLIGLSFGGSILALTLYAAPLPLPKLAGLCINELFFPVGCSLVVYFVTRLADPRAALERVVAGGG